jgi:hypothetical protein
LEVNGAALLAHVKADRRHVKQRDEGRGEHVLSRVLLDVVATTVFIDPALYFETSAHGLRYKVQNPAVRLIHYIGDGQLAPINDEFARIVHLAAASRIKSSSVQHHCVFPFALH